MERISKPEIVEKGWGKEIVICNSPRYCGKILVVEPGKKCSLHFHVVKHETFYLMSGLISMRTIHSDGSSEVFIMSPGDILEVTPGLVHQFESLEGVSQILEVSTMHNDYDSYRIVKGD